MIEIKTKFDINDTVINNKYKTGVVKNISGSFIFGDPTCEVDLFYNINFNGDIIKLQEHQLSIANAVITRDAFPSR